MPKYCNNPQKIGQIIDCFRYQKTPLEKAGVFFIPKTLVNSYDTQQKNLQKAGFLLTKFKTYYTNHIVSNKTTFPLEVNIVKFNASLSTKFLETGPLN